MALRNPVAVYIAASDLEAHIVCHVLRDSGIEAAVVEDVSRVGAWIGGLASQLHRPKVWIDQADKERAMPIIDDFERQAAERLATDRMKVSPQSETIVATCEDCGVESEFPAAQLGSVQNCPKCLSYLDVGPGPVIEGWDSVNEIPTERDDED